MYKPIIASLVVIALSVLVASYLNPNPPVRSKNVNTIPDPMPTVIPAAAETSATNYLVESVDDPKNKKINLVLTLNGQKKVIDSGKYWQMGDHTAKPDYNSFLLSSDQQFLYYSVYTGYEAYFSRLYNIKTNKTIKLTSTGDTLGFTPGNKYFYACNIGNIMGGAAEIYSLPNMALIFKSEGSYFCEYDQTNNIIRIKEAFSENEFTGKQVIYNLNTNSLTN